MSHAVATKRDGTEIRVKDEQGVTLRLGVSNLSASSFAQAVIGAPGPDRGVYLSREDAKGVRDFLNDLLEGRVRKPARQP